jgi:hypothetical protein
VTAVPEGFPFRLTDEELEHVLDEMAEPANWPGFDDFRLLLPELKLALLASGLRERDRREGAASAARALFVAWAALAVAAVTLVASVVIALAG